MNNLDVVIDKNSGYCFGVEFAIKMAEDALEESGSLYCLGDIVHNTMEVNRLKDKGLQIIDRSKLIELKDTQVLIRAHGEPPETYQIAMDNNIELIDASCPVVLKLQNRVKNSYDKTPQIVIYGKKGHAEVIGLSGQTNDNAIVVTDETDLELIDFSRSITLYSQTTKSISGFKSIVTAIEKKIEIENQHLSSEERPIFNFNDSICRQVSNRAPQMEVFSNQYDVIVFVSGKKSSNGKALYGVCKEHNENSYFIESESELEYSWFTDKKTVGICGATSTPTWLMEQVKSKIESL